MGFQRKSYVWTSGCIFLGKPVVHHPFWKVALERYIGREDLRYYLIYQLINHSVPLLQCKAVSVLSFIMHLSAVVAFMNIIPMII